MSDILMSKDGSINGPRRSADDAQSVNFYSTNPDMIYADAFKYSRMSGQQPLILALKAFMKHAFDKKVEIAQYGKPSQLSFEYGK